MLCAKAIHRIMLINRVIKFNDFSKLCGVNNLCRIRKVKEKLLIVINLLVITYRYS